MNNLKNYGFNSTMVRLKAGEELTIPKIDTVSIPLWFD